MSYKKLLVSVRYRAGDITSMAVLSMRESMLSEDKNELVLPGEFSLSKRPDNVAALDITPELVEQLKNFVANLEAQLQEPEVAAEEVVETKIAKSKEQKIEQK